MASCIIFWGYLLNFFGGLNKNYAWLLAGLISNLVLILIYRVFQIKSEIQLLGIAHKLKTFIGSNFIWLFTKISSFEKLVLYPLVFSVIVIGSINLIIVLFTAPGNWDSMTYHLARMAHYYQNNSLDYFNSSYWAQVTHPKNSTILLLFTYMIFNLNEKLTQLVQYFAYWISLFAIFGITRAIGFSKAKSLFAALVAGLLTNVLMQATTTQNDLTLTAFLGSSIFYLFVYQTNNEKKYLVLFSLSLALAIGTKEAFIMSLLPIVLILLWVFIRTSKTGFEFRKKTIILLIYFSVAFIVFSLSSGYLDNLIRFNNPLGDVASVHTFRGESFKHVVVNGIKNVIRFGINFMNFDGMPGYPILHKIIEYLQFIPRYILKLLGLQIEHPYGTLLPFKYPEKFLAHEDYSFWGILGFGLIWLSVLFSLINKTISKEIKILSLSALLFVIMQGFAGPYDPFRGRYFVACAVFAAPSLGLALTSKKILIKSYIIFIVLLGCYSAFSSIFFRYNGALLTKNSRFTNTHSFLKFDRIGQLLRNNFSYLDATRKFEELIPSDATVLTYLPEDSYEFPLFGEKLTREIIPIHLYNGKDILPPANADYLLYSSHIFPCANQDDEHLGEDWFIRKLDFPKPICPTIKNFNKIR